MALPLVWLYINYSRIIICHVFYSINFDPFVNAFWHIIQNTITVVSIAPRFPFNNQNPSGVSLPGVLPECATHRIFSPTLFKTLPCHVLFSLVRRRRAPSCCFCTGRRLGRLKSTLTLSLRWYYTLAECPWPCLYVLCAFTVTTTTGMPPRSTNRLLFLHGPRRRRRSSRRRRGTAEVCNGGVGTTTSSSSSSCSSSS